MYYLRVTVEFKGIQISISMHSEVVSGQVKEMLNVSTRFIVHFRVKQEVEKQHFSSNQLYCTDVLCGLC